MNNNPSEKKKYKKRGEVFQNESGAWAYDFSINKQRHRGTFKEARTKKQAEQALVKLKNEVFDNRHNKQFGKQLFEDFVKTEWLPHCKETKRSWHQDELFAEIWFKYFKGLRLSEIQPEHIRRYKIQRTTETTNRGSLRSPASVNHELGRLGTIFSYAMELERLQSDPCKKVKRFTIQPQAKRVLTHDESEAILNACKEKWAMYRPLFELALNTGLRIKECVTLEWQDVSFDIKRDLRGNVVSQGTVTIRVENSKSKRSRTIPFNNTTRRVLTELNAVRSSSSERVFHQRGYCRVSISHQITAICSKLRIEGVTFHAFRRTFATRLEEAGFSPFAIAALLGHSKITVTQKHGYVQPQQETLLRAVSSLDNKPTEVLQFKVG